MTKLKTRQRPIQYTITTNNSLAKSQHIKSSLLWAEKVFEERCSMHDHLFNLLSIVNAYARKYNTIQYKNIDAKYSLLTINRCQIKHLPEYDPIWHKSRSWQVFHQSGVALLHCHHHFVTYNCHSVNRSYGYALLHFSCYFFSVNHNTSRDVYTTTAACRLNWERRRRRRRSKRERSGTRTYV